MWSISATGVRALATSSPFPPGRDLVLTPEKMSSPASFASLTVAEALDSSCANLKWTGDTAAGRDDLHNELANERY